MHLHLYFLHFSLFFCCIFPAFSHFHLPIFMSYFPRISFLFPYFEAVTSFFLPVFLLMLCICAFFLHFSHFYYIYAFSQHFFHFYTLTSFFPAFLSFPLFIGNVCMYIPLPCNLFTIFPILLHLCPFLCIFSFYSLFSWISFSPLSLPTAP